MPVIPKLMSNSFSDSNSAILFFVVENRVDEFLRAFAVERLILGGHQRPVYANTLQRVIWKSERFTFHHHP